MSILKQNPFRVLGLFGNSSEREIQKQIGMIKRYAEIGKFKSFDYDFDFIGSLSRNIDDIQQAASKIEQAKNKLHYSIFWFINNSQYDEIAFNLLKSKNIEKAIEIWNKTLKKVSDKNFSSFSNLSTLYLVLSIINEQLELLHLQQAIELKGKLIHSDFIHIFSSSVTGNGINIDSTTISKKFVEEIIELLKPYLNKRNGISINELISFFSSYPSNIQKYISGKFTETPISNIGNSIEKAAHKRKNNPENADKFGEDLYNITKTDVALLKNILGKDNVQFQMIVNKLANEILQCSIEFFNKHRENNDIDPGDDAIRIAKYAGSIGASGQIKQRITENSAIIQKWVNDKPNRKKLEAVSEEIIFLENKFKWFKGLPNTIENAENLINSCKPKLISIKNKLGRQDDFYLQISSLVVNSSLNMIIEVVNREQNQLQYDQTKLIILPLTISAALSVLNQLESFDMIENVRIRYNTNKRIISNINNQLQTLTRQEPASSFGDCYIATMVYGNYNHPQVINLREFRDEKLATNFIGKCFIKFYYTTSPHLVKILKTNNRINKSLRILLDKFIERINQ